jgi:hypothetical protein
VSKVVAGKDWVVATITWVRDVGAEAKESTTLFVSELKAAGALFKRMTIDGHRGTREEHRKMEQSFREVCLLCIPLPFTPMPLASCCHAVGKLLPRKRHALSCDVHCVHPSSALSGNEQSPPVSHASFALAGVNTAASRNCNADEF